MLDPQADAGGLGEVADVDVVGRHDGVVATDGALDHGDIDDVVVGGFAREDADVSRLLLAHRIHLAEDQQPRQARLTRTASPCLGEHGDRDNRGHLLGQEAGVECELLRFRPEGWDRSASVSRSSIAAPANGYDGHEPHTRDADWPVGWHRVLVLDLIAGAVIALLVVWGFSRGVTVSTLAFAGFGAGAVLGSRLAPLILDGGLRSAYAPEVAVPGALLVGALSGALFERFGLRLHSRLDRLGPTSPVGGALLGGVLGLAVVWTLGVAAVQVDSLRGDVRRSEILSRLDSVLAPPGPPLVATVAFSDPFPTFQGPAVAVGPISSLVTRARGVRVASRSVMRIAVAGCHRVVTGTGWIATDGIVVTNAHVVAGGQIATAQFRGSGPAFAATPIWFQPKIDIALLRVPGVQGLPALSMVANPRAGTEAATIGFPFGRWADRPALLGATNSMHLGQLSTAEPLPRGFSHELFGRPITGFSGRSEPGNSGSPVVDRHGHVLATVFGGGAETGLAVPNKYVRNALEHAGPQVGTGPCPPGSSH